VSEPAPPPRTPEPAPPPRTPEPAPPPRASEPAAPPRASEPAPPPRTPEPAPPPRASDPPRASEPRAAPVAKEETVQLSWDDPVDDAKTEAPARHFMDMGRAQAKRAKEHVASVAPFVSVMTGRSIDDVERTIRAAPDDARMHALFPEYKQLKSILLKDAAFAREHGLAPVLSIIAQKPLADVEKRLAAAPGNKKLTGVFAPELARRLLGKKIAPS
jgi:hypothetical protein